MRAGVLRKDPALRLEDVADGKSVSGNEGHEIGNRWNEDQTKREMVVAETRPAVRPVPVVGTAVGKLRAPALHQSDDGEDRDTHAQRKESAPFAGAGQTESKAGKTEGDLRPLLAKTMHERGDA